MTPAQHREQEAAFQRVASASDAAVRAALFSTMQRVRKNGEALNIEAGIAGGLTALWGLVEASIQDPTPERIAQVLTDAVADLAKLGGRSS